MALTTYSPQQIFNNTVAAVQQFTTRIKNFGSGTIAGAIVHAIRSNVLWLQGDAQYLYAYARAKTSVGPDLTSFVADYNLSPPRIAETFANGGVNFIKNAPSSQTTFVLNGTIIQNTVLPPLMPTQYAVVPDPTNSTGNYNPALGGGIGGYQFAAGTTSMAALVQALVGGPAGNAIAGTLTQIASPGVGADFVQQPNDITNGYPEESDAALRVRFANFLSSLAMASLGALSAAIAAVQNSLTFTINEQLDRNQAAKPAWFTVVVDDGSGAIPGGLLTQIGLAIDKTRAAGIGRDLVGPSNVIIVVSVLYAQVLPSFSAAAVYAAIQAAIIGVVNGNGVGGYNPNTGIASGRLFYASIANAVAAFVGPLPGQGLANFGYTITVNGGVADIPIGPYQLARTNAGSVTVT